MPDFSKIDAMRGRETAMWGWGTSSSPADLGGPVLQRPHTDLTGPLGFDTVHGRRESLDGRDTRDIRLDRCRANLVPIGTWRSATRGSARRVDDHVHVAGQDAADKRLRTSGLAAHPTLPDDLGLHPVTLQHLGRARGGQDRES